MDAKTLRKAAVDGNLDVIASLLESLGDDEDEDEDGGGGDSSEDVVTAYQWYLVATHFGHKGAEEAADALLGSFLSRYGDETIAMAHYDVGVWFLTGAHGMEPDLGAAFNELEYANEMKVRSMVELEKDLEATRKKLSGDARTRFDKLFPAKKPKAKAGKK